MRDYSLKSIDYRKHNSSMCVLGTARIRIFLHAKQNLKTNLFLDEPSSLHIAPRQCEPVLSVDCHFDLSQ